MKAVYVLSNKYLPLVTLNLSPGVKHPVTKRELDSDDFKRIFYQSHEDPMIVCETFEDAQRIAAAMMREHDTNSNYVAPNIYHFASPVIYTMHLEDALPGLISVELDSLIGYMDTSTFPLYPYGNDNQRDDSLVMHLSKKSKFNIREIDGITFDDVIAIHYFTSTGLLLSASAKEPSPTAPLPPQTYSRHQHTIFKPPMNTRITTFGVTETILDAGKRITLFGNGLEPKTSCCTLV